MIPRNYINNAKPLILRHYIWFEPIYFDINDLKKINTGNFLV
jgi:hypothetical protein